MRSLLKNFIKISILFIMIYSLGISVGYTSGISSKKHLVNIYLEDTTLTSNYFTMIRNANNSKDDPYSFIAWRQEGAKTIINPELNRSINKDILFINGDSSLLADGTMLFEDDKSGCLIDEDTAYLLFGGRNIIGKKLLYNDRELYIRGIHKGPKATVIIQELSDSQGIMSGVSLDAGSEDSNYTENFINAYGLSKHTLDNKSYIVFTKVCMFILPLIMLAILLKKVSKNFMKVKNKPILKLIYGGIGLIFILIFLFITKMKISIPLEMLPNKWSDFDFWVNLYKTYEEKFKYVLYMKKYNIDIVMIGIMAKVALYSAISIICFIISKRFIKIEEKKTTFIIIILLIVFSFITIIKIDSKGFNCNTLMLWLLYPTYFICEYCTKAIFGYIEQ